MKTTIISIAFLLFACNVKQDNDQIKRSSTINVLVDVTDKKIIWPDAQHVIPLLQCAQYPEAACTLDIQVVSDKKTNPSYKNVLPDMQNSREENTYDDALFRQKQIVRFQQSIQQSFIKLYKEIDTTKSLKYSEVWASVVNTLNQLAQDTNQRKVLLIYSDLMEKNTAVNAYELIQKETVTSIAKKLKQQMSITKPLGEIMVVIVYEPKNRNEDIFFNKMFEVYKTILESSGAKVLQQANQTFYL